MKARVYNRHSRRAIALGLVAAAVFAGGAQAATEQASGDALNALKVRSEGLNLVYGLGASRPGGRYPGADDPQPGHERRSTASPARTPSGRSRSEARA